MDRLYRFTMTALFIGACFAGAMALFTPQRAARIYPACTAPAVNSDIAPRNVRREVWM